MNERNVTFHPISFHFYSSFIPLNKKDMAGLFITVVPNLKLKKGTHTVCIAVTHSGQTRYIPTEVTINSESEFKNGRIVKRLDKDILNVKQKRALNLYELSKYMTTSQPYNVVNTIQ